jgi:hypothetical protein
VERVKGLHQEGGPSFDLHDLERAVMEKFGVDKLTVKRLVRRNDQQSTIKPRDLKLLWG